MNTPAGQTSPRPLPRTRMGRLVPLPAGARRGCPVSRPLFGFLTPEGASALFGVAATLLPLVGWALVSAYLFPSGGAPCPCP